VEKNFNDIDILIANVLAGEATESEQQQLKEWMAQSEENRKQFENGKLIFDSAANASLSEKFDEDAAWLTVKAKLNAQPPAAKSRTLHFDWRIAAAVAMIIGVSGLFYLIRDKETALLTIASVARTQNDTLPDGSHVFLNKQSEVSFSFHERSGQRKVKLKGEAFFSVKHEEEKPFIIEADEILVRDIGTEFNLKAYPDKDTIEIVVTEGEVQFYTLKNAGLNLKAGESALYLKSRKEFQRLLKADTNVLAYKTKVFNFKNTELKSVIKLLNEIYQTRIALAPAIMDCQLTAHFFEDDPNTIVEVIAETMGITVSQKDKEIYLEGTGCNTH
jgi:transmembrane sensor